MDQPVFPQEIFDTITHIVGSLSDDHGPLKNLALTSQHHFLHQARPYLFRRLYILGEPTAEQMFIWYSNRTLFKHVRVVSLEDVTPDLDCGQLSPGLEAITDELQDLEELHINVAAPGLSGMFVKLFHPTLRRLSILYPNYEPILYPRSDGRFRVPHTLPKLKSLEFNGDWGRPLPKPRGPEEGDEDDEASSVLQLLCSRCKRWSEHDLSPTLIGCSTSLYASLVVLKIGVRERYQHIFAWSVIDAAASSIPTLKALALTYCFAGRNLEQSLIPATADYEPCAIESLHLQRTLPFFPSLISLNFTLSYIGTDPLEGNDQKFYFMLFGTHILALLRGSPDPQPSLTTLSVTSSGVTTSGVWSVNSTESLAARLDESLERVYGDFIDKSIYPSLRNLRLTTFPVATRHEEVTLLESGAEEVIIRVQETPVVDKFREHFDVVDFGHPSSRNEFNELENALLQDLS